MDAPGRVTPGKSNPHLCATLVLTLATVVYYAGYLVVVSCIFVAQNHVALTAGACVMVAGALIYVPGLVVYKRNSGKPQYVGFVVGNQGVQLLPQQQLFTTFAVPGVPLQTAQPPPSYDEDQKPLTSS